MLYSFQNFFFINFNSLANKILSMCYCQNNLTKYNFIYSSLNVKKRKEKIMNKKLQEDFKILQKQIANIDDFEEISSSKDNNIQKNNFNGVLLDYTSECLALLDSNSRLLTYNTNFSKILNLTNEQPIGNYIFELVSDELSEFIKDKFSEVLQTNKLVTFDEDFDKHFYKHFLQPVFDKQDNLQYVAYIIHDESKHKQKEIEVHQKLAETEIMLKEVHHRVKNNLQLIVSLLNLQKAYLTDEASLEAFQSTISRIKSMAIVHEKLYKSETLADIDFFHYVKTITGNLVAAYRYTKQDVSVIVDINDIFLNINTAIPCGLIINELVSNSLKHAFANREKGKIEISLKFKETNLYTLTVKDNGIGLPLNYDIVESSKLGLQLVLNLIDQLHGSYKISQDQGTNFTIIFQELY